MNVGYSRKEINCQSVFFCLPLALDKAFPFGNFHIRPEIYCNLLIQKRWKIFIRFSTTSFDIIPGNALFSCFRYPFSWFVINSCAQISHFIHSLSELHRHPIRNKSFTGRNNDICLFVTYSHSCNKHVNCPFQD